MLSQRPLGRVLAFVLLVSCVATGQPSLPAERVPLLAASGFAAAPGWSEGAGIEGDPRLDAVLRLIPGTGLLVGAPGSAPLASTWTHGDLHLDLDFLLGSGGGAELRLQGRHAVPLTAEGWRARGNVLAVEAIRARGLWQHLRVEFRAARAAEGARPAEPARLSRISLNGFTVAEDLVLDSLGDGSPAPLQLAAGSGSIVVRDLRVKRFERDPVTVGNLGYRLYQGSFSQPGTYDDRSPTASGVPDRFSHQAVAKTGRFALVFSGVVTVPRDGDYAFSIESRGPARLLIDGQSVVVPIERAGNQPGVIRLTAGRHEFRADLVHTSGSAPIFDLQVEGPGVAPQRLTEPDARPATASPAVTAIPVEPDDRIVLQRGFVPFDPFKRLYAASVGTPAGVHFAYDFDTGSILRAWSGRFLNAVDMWEGRGNDQLARPMGPAIAFGGKPTVGLLEYPRTNDWPDRPEALWVPKGYTLEPNGQPVFLAQLADLKVSDRIAPAANGRGLTRTLGFSGSLPSWSAWVLLAEAETITARAGGWVIGDRQWYLDWPTETVHRPYLRTINGRQQLLVPITSANLNAPVTYTLAW